MSFEGKQLGRYQLHHVLGSGGMGEVYLAEDNLIHRQVAIKVVRSEPAPYLDSESAGQAARLFEREMKVISQLDHPHILPLYDYGEAEVSGTTITYMVMPYRPEGSLLTWLRQRRTSEPLALPDVAAFIRQAASALQHAHKHQVIHQDVKPSNFLIRVRPEEPDHPDLLLTDFGISRLTTVSSTSQSIRGTPTYMAPEQWEGNPTYASDQYALAVMAYEMLVGRPPFEGTPGSMMFKHIHVMPPEPSTLKHTLSPEVDVVLLHALAKKPEERFASISAFANAFEQAACQSTPAVAGSWLSSSVSGSRPPALSSGQAEIAGSDIHGGLTISAHEAENGASPETSMPLGASPISALAEPLRMEQSGVELPMAQYGIASSPMPGEVSASPMPQGAAATPRLAVLGRTSSTMRMLLIALVLVLIGAGGGLFYFLMIMPHAAANTADHPHYSGGPSTNYNNVTPTVAHNNNVPSPTPAHAGALGAAQAHVGNTPTSQPPVSASVTPAIPAPAHAPANAPATATAAAASQYAGTMPLYRLVSSLTGDHFYTTSASERDAAITKYGYRYEGIAGHVFGTQVANSVPLYRLFSPKTGDHFYTTSVPERDAAITQYGYQYEGVASYVFAIPIAKSSPLYRLFNAKTGDHFYTLSAAERDNAVARFGYRYEEIACYILSS